MTPQRSRSPLEIRDVVHGSITIERAEHPILDSRYFQRLRQIKQLGFAEHSFPGTTHNRYVHSLGAMEIASLAFDSIFSKGAQETLTLSKDRARQFKAAVRLAALLHDIGHAPLSHTTEFAMPEVRHLALPATPLVGAAGPRKSRQATHEDYSLKIILDSGLTTLLKQAGAHHGFSPVHIAALIDSRIEITDDFFEERIEGQKIDFRPILRQLISSELDADRMDYLKRDSLYAGVSYGEFDSSWLLRSLTYHIKDAKCYLTLEHKALYAFEDFLISRYHMFLMVYFHYKNVVFDSMLSQYFKSPDCEYSLPADIEKYCDSSDADLLAHLAKSKNEWARRITEKRPYRMLIELHSGIPATKTATSEQEKLLVRIAGTLDSQQIHYLKATSTGELSKYFGKPGDPIFVRYDNHYSAPSFIPLEHCTDLFQKYTDKRSITRLYVAPERYAECRNQGRGSPLPYEDSHLEAVDSE